MSRFRTLAAIFSPTYRASGDEGAVLRAGGPLGPQVVVAPRSECAYHRFDFERLRPRQRPAAARLAAVRQEPVPGAPVHLAWTGGIAHAWWWLEAPGTVTQGGAPWLPETLLRAPPATDGVRLVAALQGYEGEAWTGGRLAGSQWWPRLPTGAQWARFMRGCGLPAGSPPEPVEPGIQPHPWGDRARGISVVSPEQAERRAWQALAVGLALFLGWQLAGLAHWTVVAGRTEARLDALRRQSSPLLDARDRAEAARIELEQLERLAASVDDKAMMVEIARRLPEEDAIAAWAREGNRLTLEVRTTSEDPRVYVAALESLPGVEGLQAIPEGGAMGIRLELDGAAGAAADPAPRDAM